LSANTPRAGGSDPRIIRKTDPYILDNTVAKITRQFDMIGKYHLTRWFQNADIAVRGDGIVTSVIGNAVSQQRSIALGKFHVAGSDDVTGFLLVA
jgi:hypothetical protein